ncbi:hypothetical protein LAZ40_21275 [Cereibacter sphaeroides]|uniref:hypothetical protein n=1 Tax=Cereibacter sphaeroides TaxID=1063 RepID=UPI001F2E498C|nr:hypothetical protein [Cereibacter sphaeroides]MCE6961567.1 hypothetical protein [Cereibacter sphaeroides]MCE6967882.1 hypothetical protein [Cereibacter sphaeroides]MCE6971140.1 hypothetical protein [Cereibacter sphaeroides]
MSQNDAPTIREGSQTAHEVYLSVGLALSWWEASEDMLEMLFTQLCGATEPVATETFRVAPRQSRAMMIKSALKHHDTRATPEEASIVIDAIKKIEKLAPTRNEIAHGHVSNITETIDGNIVKRGNFLSSTLNPWGDIASRESNKKYAHTAAEIDDWRDKVRHERGRIMDVWQAIIMRDQAARNRAPA